MRKLFFKFFQERYIVMMDGWQALHLNTEKRFGKKTMWFIPDGHEPGYKILIDGYFSSWMLLKVSQKVAPDHTYTLVGVKQSWYDQNAPFGRELGYPECCIKEFCDYVPRLGKKDGVSPVDHIRYEASFMNGQYTGFIPCAKHAKQILDKKITLESLIKNRSKKYQDFPYLIPYNL